MGAGTCSARWRQRYTTIGTADNWQTKITAAAAGTRFSVASGTHRGVTFSPKASQVFIGPSTAIVNGSTVITSWTSDGAGKWSSTGFPAQDAPTGSILGEPDVYGPLFQADGVTPTAAARLPNYRNELFRNSIRLIRVLTKAEVVSGKWWFDTATNTAWIADTPVGQTMEHSRLARMVDMTGVVPFVTFQGFVVEKYANETQAPVISPIYGGDIWQIGWTYRNFTSRLNHGYGLFAGSGDVVTGCLMEKNGHLGLGGYGGALIDADGGMTTGGAPTGHIEIAWNIIRNNNALHHHYANEGGALKFAGCRSLRLHHNRIHDNNGKGIWADINNQTVVFEDNLVYNHQEDGIVIEISFGPAIIRNNRVINCGNRGKTTDGTFWAWCNGIALQNSSNTEVYGNYIEAWAGANAWFMIYQSRTEYLEGPFGCTGNSFHDNTIVAATGSTGAGSGVMTDHPDQAAVTAFVAANSATNNTYKGPVDDFSYPLANLTDVEWGFPLSSVQSLARSGWEAGSTWTDGTFAQTNTAALTV